MAGKKTLIKSREDVEKRIKSFIEELKKEIIVDKVILYGSWADGHPDEFSDIDLAVFSPDFGESRLNELQMLSKVAWEVDKAIEAVPYPSSRLKNVEASSFVSKIIETGEVVYD